MSAPSLQKHWVTHHSTNPANANTDVQLFVGEYDGTPTGQDPKPVLMLHGRSVPVLAGYDLVLAGVSGDDAVKYSWAQQLAKLHYDVFLMDLQGSGLSPRPKMDDPCNANPAQRQDVLGPLAAACSTPPYPHELGNSESERDELATVVGFIQGKHPNKKIDFVGWSAAGLVMGPYVLQNPDQVRSLFLLAPIYPPKGRWSKDPANPFGRPPEITGLPVTPPQAAFGFPMNVTSKTGFTLAWDRETASPLQRDAGMADRVWAAMMDNDSEGSKWGPLLASGSHEGVLRYRNNYWWGWNDQTVPHRDAAGTPVLGERVPVAIVHGELDRTANTPAALPVPDVLRFSVPALYAAVPGTKKLMFQLADASHSMVWERAAQTLHHITSDWLRDNRVYGRTDGSYYRATDGDLISLE
ncbi:alpha/beta fold hydrolase [Streptomyces bungoensis]|uniref:alpha/beta fold hydrolase n=1 Tax=Streptomyces bungoensis TaxID=285568 RepID=UPI003441B25E